MAKLQARKRRIAQRPSQRKRYAKSVTDPNVQASQLRWDRASSEKLKLTEWYRLSRQRVANPKTSPTMTTSLWWKLDRLVVSHLSLVDQTTWLLLITPLPCYGDRTPPRKRLVDYSAAFSVVGQNHAGIRMEQIDRG